MTYEVFKFLHILGVVFLVGNVTVTAVWKVFADRTSDSSIIGFAQRMVTVTDIGLTASGIVLIAVGGFGAMLTSGMDLLATPWLLWGLALFGISGVVWLGILVPIQISLAHMARNFGEGGEIPTIYRIQSSRWLRWGIVATVPLVAAMWVMVAKR